MGILQTSFFAALLSLGYGVYLIGGVLKKSPGNETMQEIQKAIQEGAEAYLKRQNKTVFWVGLFITVVLYIWLGQVTAVGFVLGAVASALAGYIGMMVAVRANVRVAQEA